MKKIHYFIGRFSMRYRSWYWNTHDGKYLWGLMRFLRDTNRDVQHKYFGDYFTSIGIVRNIDTSDKMITFRERYTYD